LFGNVITQFYFAERERNLVAIGFEKESEQVIGYPNDKRRNVVEQPIETISRNSKKL
jgi:hypothetical protein